MFFAVLLFAAAAQPPALPHAICDRLNIERNKFPTLIQKDADLGTILNNTAWAFRHEGWGLSGKTFGTKCQSRAGEIACDILHRKTDNMLWDVIVAAGAGFASTIHCAESIGPPPGSNRPWVAPVDPGTIPIEPPPQDKFNERITALEISLGHLATKVAELATLIDHQHPHTHELDTDKVKAIVNEIISTLKIDLSRSWGHSHSATIVR